MEILSRLREEIAQTLEVVVIDDEQPVLDALHRVLRKLPLKVEYYSDPVAALEYLKTREVAAVVCDNVMPKLSGLELFAALKKLQPLTRRIMLTGYVEHSEAVQAFNEGVIHQYLSKPWEKEELLAQIESAGERFLSAKLDQRLEKIKDLTLKKRSHDLSRAQERIANTETQFKIASDQLKKPELKLSAGLAQLSLMIVEPHVPLCNELSEAFTRLNLPLIQAYSDGKKALAAANQEDPPELILCEWDLPGVDDLALVHSVRRKQASLFRPLLVVTSTRADRSQIARAYRAGADGFLLKPFGLLGLVDFFEEALARRTEEQQVVHNLKKLKYLVISKNSAQRLWISQFLSRMNAERFYYATDGPKAVPMLEKEGIDLVFLDCGTGSSALAAFQKTLNRANLKVPAMPFHLPETGRKLEDALPPGLSQVEFERHLQRFVHQHLEAVDPAAQKERLLKRLLGEEVVSQMKG